ncbi:unnamed protein product [Haemonchus placei]|uniref:Renin receptor-like C-terminal transmembrane spanning segment domain-containing protein n=1 Tax=Haemonchus placei TaxID=6290 RepID=A0A3P7V4J5_HAEPC|nr:unnamed protein product [Haemonchus placei]
MFVTLPNSLSIPAPSAVPELRLSSLPLINENLLGLSAKSVQGFDAKSDLFTRPRAIAVVRVDGIDSLNSKDHTTYQLENVSFRLILIKFDRESVSVNRDGISGSEIAKVATTQEIKDVAIKTKLTALRQELENVHRLADAIASQGAKFEKSNAADVYRVTISGLAGKQLNSEDLDIAVKDIQNAVNKLAQALATAYGDQAIVEVVAISETRVGNFITLTWREQLNVYVFTSTDYPAIFAIFAGLVIALVLAVLYTAVGMMSMDPSKDSIIYRMTTTRMKKA